MGHYQNIPRRLCIWKCLHDDRRINWHCPVYQAASLLGPFAEYVFVPLRAEHRQICRPNSCFPVLLRYEVEVECEIDRPTVTKFGADTVYCRRVARRPDDA